MRRWEWEKQLRKRRDIPATGKLVALTLATYADGTGESAHPGAAQLADDTGLSERTIWRWLKHLRHLGLFEAEHRQGKGWGKRADVYRLSDSTVQSHPDTRVR